MTEKTDDLEFLLKEILSKRKKALQKKRLRKSSMIRMEIRLPKKYKQRIDLLAQKTGLCSADIIRTIVVNVINLKGNSVFLDKAPYTLEEY